MIHIVVHILCIQMKYYFNLIFRRHLKWPSADYSKAKHKDYEREWNSKMASELVPRALRQLVLHAIESGEAPANVYRLFPDPSIAQVSGHMTLWMKKKQKEKKMNIKYINRIIEK